MKECMHYLSSALTEPGMSVSQSWSLALQQTKVRYIVSRFLITFCCVELGSSLNFMVLINICLNLWHITEFNNSYLHGVMTSANLVMSGIFRFLNIYSKLHAKNTNRIHSHCSVRCVVYICVYVCIYYLFSNGLLISYVLLNTKGD